MGIGVNHRVSTSVTKYWNRAAKVMEHQHRRNFWVSTIVPQKEICETDSRNDWGILILCTWQEPFKAKSPGRKFF